MSGRKILLALIVITCSITLYLIFDNKLHNTKRLLSKQTEIPFETKTKSRSKSSKSTNDKIPNSSISMNEEFGIFECFPDLSIDAEVRTKNISLYIQSLSGSSNETDSLHYALFGTPVEGGSKIDLLFDHHNKFPNNPIVSKDLISLCINDTDKRCTTNFINDAIAIDSNNGAVWTSVISFHASNANDEEVFNAIDGLTKSLLFNERYGEKALVFSQALAGSTENNFTLNANAGLQNAFASFPSYSTIITWCENGIKEIERADACLILGEQLETRSKTILSKSVGITLQKMVYETNDDVDAVKIMKTKSNELTSILQNKSFLKASIMLMLDERLLRSWLNNLDLYGEFDSQQLLSKEALALYEQNENQLCTLIYETLGVF